ncbi:hypothetical protein NQ176_g1370 [Zarea fungicola]|uniref:Uncharacterized protein n=1 Tax=Zarea fungicola TaxID=93591 RepID=A0ACC1NTR4_9HYPO|nr:hypothetical protein NQ176_g1370 [Lecanicillium fungicola]
MDGASLHDNLRAKLNYLEAELQAHRLDLLGEFHQYYHDLTQDVSSSIVAGVEERLNPLLGNYETLRPSIPRHKGPAVSESATTAVPAESPPPPASDNRPETATTSQTLLLASIAADSGSTSSDVPRSSRDRDQELQGLFTPSYLPLLGARALPITSHFASTGTTTHAATNRQLRSSAACNSSTIEMGRLPTAELNSSSSDTTTQTYAMVHAVEEVDPRFPTQLRTTSPPRRRPSGSETADAVTANDFNSSASSDKSESKPPRSALRRSSSTYKSPQSPRRVRFEFMGAEILPSASPQASDSMMPRSDSPFWEGENVTVDSILGDDSDDLGPPPRKISSSDALRALSREPLEDGTVWTVVNPDTELSAPKTLEQVGVEHEQSSPEPAIHQVHQKSSDNENEIEDGGLAMKKSRSPGGSQAGRAASKLDKESPKQQPISEDLNVLHDDDLFEFEDEGGTTSTARRLQPQVVDEESEDEQAADAPASIKGPGTFLSAATVTPTSVPIARPEVLEPTTPTTPRQQIGSVGSYKGRSIVMPIVKNPEVHAKAASIGNFNSFVGGLDGTSGMDAADLSSYRASFMRDGFSGTPRSFTERLMMEDMEVEKRNREERENGDQT